MTAARGGVSEFHGHPGVRRLGHGQGDTTSSVAHGSPIDELRQSKNVASKSAKPARAGFITISANGCENEHMIVKDNSGSVSSAIAIEPSPATSEESSPQYAMDHVLDPTKSSGTNTTADDRATDERTNSADERRISLDSEDREKIADADYQRFNEKSPTDNTKASCDRMDIDFNTTFRFTTSRPATGGGVCKLICELTIMLELCKSLGTRPSKVNMMKAEALVRCGNRFFAESSAKEQRRAYRYHSYLTKFCPPLEETCYQRLRTLYTNWWGCAFRTSRLNVVDDIIADIRKFVGPVVFPIALELNGLQIVNDLSVSRRSSVGVLPISMAITRRNKSLPMGIPSSQGISRFLRSVTRSCSLGSSSGAAVDILADNMLNAHTSHTASSSAPPLSGYVYLQANGAPMGRARLNTLPGSADCRRPVKARCKSMSVSPPEHDPRPFRPHASVRVEEPRTSHDSGMQDEYAHIFPMSLHNTDDEDTVDARVDPMFSHSFSQSVLGQSAATEEIYPTNHTLGKQPKRWAPRMKKAVKGLSELSTYSVDMFKRTKKFDAYSPAGATGIGME